MSLHAVEAMKWRHAVPDMMYEGSNTMNQPALFHGCVLNCETLDFHQFVRILHVYLNVIWTVKGALSHQVTCDRNWMVCHMWKIAILDVWTEMGGGMPIQTLSPFVCSGHYAHLPRALHADYLRSLWVFVHRTCYAGTGTKALVFLSGQTMSGCMLMNIFTVTQKMLILGWFSLSTAKHTCIAKVLCQKYSAVLDRNCMPRTEIGLVTGLKQVLQPTAYAWNCIHSDMQCFL